MILNIKTILLDMGDILFNAHQWRYWLFKELKKRGVINYNFKTFYLAMENALKDVYMGYGNYQEVYLNFLRELKLNEIESFYEESIYFKKKIEDNRKLYFGVKSTLRYLKNKNKKVLIVTDSEDEGFKIKENLYNKYFLKGLIDEVYSSKDIRIEKSDPAFFMEILSLINDVRDNVAFVGHDIDELISAKSVGIKTIIFNNYLNFNIKADFHIKKFSDLKYLIK